MIDKSVIHSPSHYLTGRTIQPIDVIEDWNLDHDHHLACVVKYIARAGRKNPILEDLMKAEWYLERALSKAIEYCQDELIPQQTLSNSKVTHPPQNICDDWQLSDALCSALINLFLSRSQPDLLKENLKAALDYLEKKLSFMSCDIIRSCL